MGFDYVISGSDLRESCAELNPKWWCGGCLCRVASPEKDWSCECNGEKICIPKSTNSSAVRVFPHGDATKWFFSDVSNLTQEDFDEMMAVVWLPFPGNNFVAAFDSYDNDFLAGLRYFLLNLRPRGTLLCRDDMKQLGMKLCQFLMDVKANKEENVKKFSVFASSLFVREFLDAEMFVMAVCVSFLFNRAVGEECVIEQLPLDYPVDDWDLVEYFTIIRREILPYLYGLRSKKRFRELMKIVGCGDVSSFEGVLRERETKNREKIDESCSIPECVSELVTLRCSSPLVQLPSMMPSDRRFISALSVARGHQRGVFVSACPIFSGVEESDSLVVAEPPPRQSKPVKPETKQVQAQAQGQGQAQSQSQSKKRRKKKKAHSESTGSSPQVQTKPAQPQQPKPAQPQQPKPAQPQQPKPAQPQQTKSPSLSITKPTTQGQTGTVQKPPAQPQQTKPVSLSITKPSPAPQAQTNPAQTQQTKPVQNPPAQPQQTKPASLSITKPSPAPQAQTNPAQTQQTKPVSLSITKPSPAPPAQTNPVQNPPAQPQQTKPVSLSITKPAPQGQTNPVQAPPSQPKSLVIERPTPSQGGGLQIGPRPPSGK